MTEIHICAPACDDHAIVRVWCPTCDKMRYMTAIHYEWYGWYHTCLRCGEHWGDGEMLERPFMRGWRKENTKEAKEQWRRLEQR